MSTLQLPIQSKDEGMRTCPERARQDSPGSRYSAHPGLAIAPAAASGGRESLAEKVAPMGWDIARQRLPSPVRGLARAATEKLVAITLRVMDAAAEWIVHLPNAVLTRSVRATRRVASLVIGHWSLVIFL